jgi:hypothetical protein
MAAALRITAVSNSYPFGINERDDQSASYLHVYCIHPLKQTNKSIDTTLLQHLHCDAAIMICHGVHC